MKNYFSLAIFVSSLSLLQGCSASKPELVEETASVVPKISDEVVLSEAARARLGLKSATLTNRQAVENVATTGEIKADDSRVFHINALTTGRVMRDNVSLGQTIRAGQILARIQNLEIVKIFSEYIHQTHQIKVDKNLAETKLALARKTYERTKMLFDEKISPEKDLIKAASDVKIEEQTVAGLGEHAHHLKIETQTLLAAYGVRMPAADVEMIDSTSPIVTPRAGVVTTKNVTVGDVVSSAEPLYVVADLSKVWLDLAVYDKQLASIREGSGVIFTSDSLPGKNFSGKVTYLKPAAEENSGTFVARVTLENPHFDLKPGMVGQARIQNSSVIVHPFVPEAALQKMGNEAFVFLNSNNGHYKKRKIILGQRLPGGYLATQGIKAGENIVTEGSFALKAEMLKATLSEGE
jgi:cobalt-zinc-cadmium efflux system membrane fusion protein